jgi:adenylate kinase
MFDNISFIGGIHGVGKSNISYQICEALKLQYLSASDLLKWEEINIDIKDKRVNNIEFTQDRLIMGLERIINIDTKYLLDGHYCLLNSENDVKEIPINTFKIINPMTLNLITGDIVSAP